MLDGLAQLIWNAIDAEAGRVQVDIAELDDRVAEIRVTDDGHGIDVATAHRKFGVLGDS
jgi:DNA mismatch repair ATPase MutL